MGYVRENCSSCGGSGYIIHYSGLENTKETCNRCNGNGYIEHWESDSGSSSSSSSSSYTPSSSGKPQGEPPDVLIEQGNMWARTEKYEGAISFFTKAINHPFCSAKVKSEAYENRGYCYEQLNKHKEAVEDCANAINIDSTRSGAYLTRGLALYQLGFFDPPKQEQAIANLKKAADLGSDTALKALSQFGVQYMPGSGGYSLEAKASGGSSSASADANRGSSSSEMFSAVSIPANASANELSKLAKKAYDADDYVKAVALWIKAEEKGCTNINKDNYRWSLNEVASDADTAKNYVAAFELYLKSANMGYKFAQHNLANCYFYGTGVAKDYAKAKEWYEKAAKQGYEGAKKQLDWLKANGF